MKERGEPKTIKTMEGDVLVIRKINDLIYRICLGPNTKPKVAHRN